MNVNTGQIYRGFEAIDAAKQRGEPIVEVSERVAQTMEAGQFYLNRHDRRKQAKLNRAASTSQPKRKKRR